MRLSQSDLDAFLLHLHQDFPTGVIEKRSLRAMGYRLWLTLLDDAAPGQLRVRKLTMAIVPEVGSGRQRRSREWFSSHPEQDRWSEIDREEESSPDAVLAAVKFEFLRAVAI